MKENDTFDLIIKAFGIYFLVLAIMSIPGVLSGLLMLFYYTINGLWDVTEGDINKVLKMTKSSHLSLAINNVLRFIIYIIASINFLRSGSWVKKLMKAKENVKSLPSDQINESGNKG